MILTLAQVGARPPKSGAKGGYESLTALYMERVGAWHTAQVETLATEALMLEWLGRSGRGRTVAVPVLLDSRGKAMNSREFALWLEAKRDAGAGHVAFAIGPADGWSEGALEFARGHGGMVLSLGPMTMAHDLARLVMAEQVYRACTILAGHPYHVGH